jgi:hypothetical protein
MQVPVAAKVTRLLETVQAPLVLAASIEKVTALPEAPPVAETA